jgi:sugar (pentulose or hexulose) kinase
MSELLLGVDIGTSSTKGVLARPDSEVVAEAMRWRVPVKISRDDLEALVEVSEVVSEREAHRLQHQGDWQRGA